MSDFKVGDVVKLKSGGPSMTVVEVAEDKDRKVLSAQWFYKERGEFQVENFLADCVASDDDQA